MENSLCRNTFDKTVNIVIAAVKEKLACGELNIDDLDGIEKALTRENQKVDAFCHSVHEHCLHKTKLDFMVPPRTNAYGRIMVQPLERLFDKKHRRFSERQLSNYFHMLVIVLGRATYERYHEEVAHLMRVEIRDHGDNFSWDEFYDHDKVVYIRLQTLAAIAHAFKNFDRRLSWLMEVMEGFHHEGDNLSATMPFTLQQAKAFLLALFGECLNLSEIGKEKLQKKLSAENFQDIVHLIVNVEGL